MTRNRVIRQLVWVALVLTLPVLLVWPAEIPADQAQYFYDDLGRLSGVADSTGNTAVYNYDAVGNLLFITRNTPPGSGIGIYLLAPSSGPITAQVSIQGYGFDPTPANNTVKFHESDKLGQIYFTFLGRP